MKYATILLFCTILLVGFGCATKQKDKSLPKESTPVIDRASILFEAKQSGLILDDQTVVAMRADAVQEKPVGFQPSSLSAFISQKTVGWKDAALADVTAGGSFGLAHATFANGQYLLFAKMGNLPEPQNGFFYEGWIVRRGETLSVMSVGRAQRVGDQYVNAFRSKTDLSNHDFFVLTLEPSDNNPVPAEPILEGILR